MKFRVLLSSSLLLSASATHASDCRVFINENRFFGKGPSPQILEAFAERNFQVRVGSRPEGSELLADFSLLCQPLTPTIPNCSVHRVALLKHRMIMQSATGDSYEAAIRDLNCQ